MWLQSTVIFWFMSSLGNHIFTDRLLQTGLRLNTIRHSREVIFTPPSFLEFQHLPKSRIYYMPNSTKMPFTGSWKRSIPKFR